MRNSIVYSAILASTIIFGTVSVAVAEPSKNTVQGSSEMMKGEGMHMMDGNKMPMMQEMNSMMKNCNEMMRNMNKQMDQNDGKAR